MRGSIRKEVRAGCSQDGGGGDTDSICNIGSARGLALAASHHASPAHLLLSGKSRSVSFVSKLISGAADVLMRIGATPATRIGAGRTSPLALAASATHRTALIMLPDGVSGRVFCFRARHTPAGVHTAQDATQRDITLTKQARYELYVGINVSELLV
jgi:hypothetical protein